MNSVKDRKCWSALDLSLIKKIVNYGILQLSEGSKRIHNCKYSNLDTLYLM